MTDNEKRLTQILEAAHDAFIATDAEGKIIDWNLQATSLLGWSKPEALGEKLSYLILSAQERQLYEVGQEHFLSSGKKERFFDHRVEIEARHREGHALPVEISVTPLTVDGVVTFNAFIRDIRESKHHDQVKDEFISKISHEMRTPLTVMRQAVWCFKDGIFGKLTAPQGKALDMIQNNIDRFAHIISDLVDLSRLENGKTQCRPKPLKLYPFLQQVLEQHRYTANQRHLQLVEEVPKQIHNQNLEVDPDLMTQAINHIFDNAFRFAKETIHFQTQTKKSHVLLSIKDDGVGIDAPDINVVFDKFVQLNRPAGGHGPLGTGIGLSICKKIMDLHHGRIWIESKVNQGAQITLQLPLSHPSI